jgi:hypothetical protein
MQIVKPGRQLTLLTTLSVLLIAARSQAQCTTSPPTGNSQVTDTSCTGNVTSSPAYIDATAFTSTASPVDMCDNVNSILLSQQSQSSPPPGVVVDARGLNVLNSLPESGTTTRLNCGINPYNGVTGAVPSVLLLPPGNIALIATWVLPSNSRIVGVAPSLPTAEAIGSTIMPAANFTPSSTGPTASPAGC